MYLDDFPINDILGWKKITKYKLSIAHKVEVVFQKLWPMVML